MLLTHLCLYDIIYFEGGDCMEIKERLIAIRESRGYSKKTVSEMTKIPYTTYVKYESGERKDVSMQALCKLADFYNVTTDYLLGREPKKESDIDYEEVKRKTAQIIERIESLSPEYQAFMIKIIHMLDSIEQDVSTDVQLTINKPEIKQSKNESPMVYCGTIGEELERRKSEEEATRKDTTFKFGVG